VVICEMRPPAAQPAIMRCLSFDRTTFLALQCPDASRATVWWPSSIIRVRYALLARQCPRARSRARNIAIHAPVHKENGYFLPDFAGFAPFWRLRGPGSPAQVFRRLGLDVYASYMLRRRQG